MKLKTYENSDIPQYAQQAIGTFCKRVCKLMFTKKDMSKRQKILLFSVGENYNYFNMKVQFKNEGGQTYNYEVKQICSKYVI